MGGLTAAVLLDCDETYMRQKCAAAESSDADVVSRRVSAYKHSTLPVLGYLEDNNKLEIVLVSIDHCSHKIYTRN